VKNPKIESFASAVPWVCPNFCKQEHKMNEHSLNNAQRQYRKFPPLRQEKSTKISIYFQLFDF